MDQRKSSTFPKTKGNASVIPDVTNNDDAAPTINLNSGFPNFAMSTSMPRMVQPFRRPPQHHLSVHFWVHFLSINLLVNTSKASAGIVLRPSLDPGQNIFATYKSLHLWLDRISCVGARGRWVWEQIRLLRKQSRRREEEEEAAGGDNNDEIIIMDKIIIK